MQRLRDDRRRAKVDAAQRKQLDELQSEALKYLVEVFTEDEKNTRQDVYGFLTKIGGDSFAGKVVRALAVQFYDQAHYERGIEAYELLLKLEPASSDAPATGARDRAGLQRHRGLAEAERDLRARSRHRLHRPGAAALGEDAGRPRRRRARRTAEIEKQLREHALQLHAKAQKDKTSRAEFEGAAGLYDVYSRSSARDGARTRSSTTSARSTSTTSTRRPTPRPTTWRRARHAEDDAKGAAEDSRHDALYNAIAALERVRFAELEAERSSRKERAGDRGRQEVRRGARALRAALSRRSRASPSSSSARAGSTTTTGSTTRR